MKKKFRLALFLVLMLGFIPIQKNSYSIADKSERIGVTSEKKNYWKLSKNVLARISVAAMENSSYKVKIASTLQKIGKNLILENTRGTKEINAYQKVAPAVVFILTKSGFGSGSVIDPKGRIITNWHVVKDYLDVVVVFKPKDSTELKEELAFAAQVVKTDPISDLALLKLSNPTRSFRFMHLGDASKVSVGQDVHAIGHPQGEIWTYTKGIISQIRSKYEWVTEGSIKHHAEVIQTQTPISPGSSGGPLFDDTGKLIGINSFQHQSGNLNYAVAVSEIKKFLHKKESLKRSSNKSKTEPQCLESYDTVGRGWFNIEGCLFFSDNLPPDLWIVYDAPNKPPSYVAMDPDGVNRINMVTVTTSKDNKWQDLLHLMDTDCDGIIDLIGQQKAGEEDIGSYRRPHKKIYIKSIAGELDQALKSGKIPYQQIRVCQ